jgi:hypothetical protein
MRLTVFNGSPRGVHSNTGVLLNAFVEGFASKGDNAYRLELLIRRNRSTELARLFGEAEHVLLAFPLYFDAMPAIVKDFIESLESFCGRPDNPTIGFIVQSGFPESIQSKYIERYLERLASRLGCPYKGTVIKGGVEGIRVAALQESWIGRAIVEFGKATDLGGVGHLFDVEKLRRAFFDLGRIYGETGEFDKNLVAKLAHPQKVSVFGFWVVQISLRSLYWDHMLKANKAYQRRSDRPYAIQSPSP